MVSSGILHIILCGCIFGKSPSSALACWAAPLGWPLNAGNAGWPGEVAGFVRRAASLKDCEQAGAVDFATTDLLAAVSGADLVVLCTPLAQMRSLVTGNSSGSETRRIVTDVGSVKASVVRELESLVAKSGAHFVGSHPMAGGEKTA